MSFYSDRKRKFQKNSIKIKKIRKHHQSFFTCQNRLGMAKKVKKLKKYNFGGIPSQNWLEKAQREKIKIIVSFRSVPTRRVREN